MRAVRAVVGGRLDNTLVTLGIMIDVFLAKRRYVEQAVQQVRTPVDQARVFPDVVASRTKCGQWAAFKEGGRANDRLLSCVVATPVTGPRCLRCQSYVAKK